MSIFSKIKSAKKAAADHKATATSQESQKPAAAPYRHVPTHAGIDALTGSPSGFKNEDRAAIRRENHKRLSRQPSSRSSLTMGTFTRNSSYQNFGNPHPLVRNGNSYLSTHSSATANSRHGSYMHNPNYDGTETQGPASKQSKIYHGRSPLATMPISPVGSSNSSTSGEAIEMPNHAPHYNARPSYQHVNGNSQAAYHSQHNPVGYPLAQNIDQTGQVVQQANDNQSLENYVPQQQPRQPYAMAPQPYNPLSKKLNPKQRDSAPPAPLRYSHPIDNQFKTEGTLVTAAPVPAPVAAAPVANPKKRKMFGFGKRHSTPIAAH